MRENNQYGGEFENMLKEAANSLRLSPAPKVWKGIFKHLHPKLKYPSPVTILILIAGYFLLGTDTSQTFRKFQVSDKGGIIPGKEYPKEAFIVITQTDIQQTPSSANRDLTRQEEYLFSPDKSNKNKPNPSEIKEALQNSKRSLSKHQYTDTEAANEMALEKLAIPSGMYISQHDFLRSKGIQLTRPLNGARRGIAYQIYATPSISAFYLDAHSQELNPENKNSSEAEVGKSFTNMNFEAGGNIIVPINHNFRLKAGFQVNYYRHKQGEAGITETNGIEKYDADVASINSPLRFESNDDNPGSRTYQFSMPIGADIMLAGDELVQWYAGATIQPGLIMTGDKSITQKPELSIKTPGNRWNMNGGIETFINVKLNKLVNINLGPQFRYEIISSYRNQLNFYDRPFQLGFKFGITTSF
jgi:hypothetical protein